MANYFQSTDLDLFSFAQLINVRKLNHSPYGREERVKLFMYQSQKRLSIHWELDMLNLQKIISLNSSSFVIICITFTRNRDKGVVELIIEMSLLTMCNYAAV